MEFWLPYALCFLILAAELRTFNRRTGTIRKDAWSKQLITVFYFAGYTGAFFLRRHPPLLGSWALAAGAVLAVSGTAFRAWSIGVLGKYFTRTVQVSPDQKVVEAGPYHWIRHPSYTGNLVASLGVALSLRSSESLACLMIPAALAMGYRMTVEEKALAETLGEPYRAYMRRTKRLIPFIL